MKEKGEGENSIIKVNENINNTYIFVFIWSKDIVFKTFKNS